jgi:hypothetical protein
MSSHPSCAVPECHGIGHADPTFREALWDRFFTAAPRPRTPFELLQRSKASIQELASRYDLNPKTVMKWRKRAFLYCSYGAEGASLNGTQLCLRNATARASSRRSLGQRCSLTSTHSFTNAFGTVIPYVKIHTILTDNGIQFCDLPKNRSGPTVRWQTHMFVLLCQAQQPL